MHVGRTKHAQSETLGVFTYWMKVEDYAFFKLTYVSSCSICMVFPCHQKRSSLYYASSIYADPYITVYRVILLNTKHGSSTYFPFSWKSCTLIVILGDGTSAILEMRKPVCRIFVQSIDCPIKQEFPLQCKKPREKSD